ncbi:hypothetical protein L0665_02780 [Methanogenium marinum]|uniref:Uncharacterized protein n=1 Tax=Methanogenium marinum TaxID=348610 RepID=A0A9Q4PYB0_9EURY|nr:hypothetical protein [Methanogenium marinum]MDE4907542.1 hypothetical protein [Methanogenium marinum]
MTDKTSSLPELPKYAWVSVPIIAFAGIAISMLSIWTANPGVTFIEIITDIVPKESFLTFAGIWGCIISSFILCGIAYLKPKKDLVSLLVPIFAIIIFNPWSEFTTGPIMQILFAITITVIAVRLEKKYSDKLHFSNE